MMTVYIDSDCRCHVSDDGTMTAVQTRFFDGMCREFIEGYRFIPAGGSLCRAARRTAEKGADGGHPCNSGKVRGGNLKRSGKYELHKRKNP